MQCNNFGPNGNAKFLYDQEKGSHGNQEGTADLEHVHQDEASAGSMAHLPIAIGCTPRGSCNNTLLLEGFFGRLNYRGFSNVPCLAHQNRTIAIASDFRVDGAKSPKIPQKEGVLGSEIAARNRRSLATFHRTLKSQCIIAVSSLGNRAISGVRDGHRNRKSQKSLRFRCAKVPWRKRAFGPGTRYVFLEVFLRILETLCKGKGAPLVRYLCTT